MRRSLRMTFRFIMVVAVLAMIPVAVAPSGSTETPYLSALSNLAAVPAFAAKPTCENKTCVHSSSGKASCQPNPLTNCIFRHGGALCGGSTC